MLDSLRRQRRRVAAGDDGMTLVEVMIACVILVIMSSAVLGILLSTNKTTHDDKLRVAASDLAAREVEIVRQQFESSTAAVKTIVNPANDLITDPDPLPTGGSAGQPLVVDGVPFTVVRTVAVQVLGPGVSACDGGSGVAHPSYSVTATVTWPNMGLTKPVVNQTVLTPPKGVIQDNTYGYLAVKVLNAAGTATSSVPVSVQGPAGTYTANTDSSGCAVVPLSTAGNYTASLNSAGYVDYYGNPTPSLTSIDVEIGQLTVKSMTYDKAAEINATLTTASGHSLPQTLPQLVLANSGLQPSGTKTVPAGGTSTALAGLWPFTSGYTLWAGSCADSDPAQEGATRTGPVASTSGGAAAVQVPLAPLDVSVYDDEGNPVIGATVTAVDATVGQAGSTCQSDGTLTLGTTDVNGHLATSIPDGGWTVSAAGASSTPLTINGSPVSTEVDLP